MSQATILGIKKVDFNDVHGYSLFVAEKTENTIGIEPNKLWLKVDKAAELVKPVGGDYAKLVNRPCEVVYNKNGKAEIVRLVG